ncbi:hypothetical protein M9Y10_001541 [Tritrichomonas musculus]|uniref:Uncharacterized protein n=1 Tax=Tritrichomonas musculus TaxID=1915356 RepID=A0ABR2L796_9EUKA
MKNKTSRVGSFQLILKWKYHHGTMTPASTLRTQRALLILTSSNDCGPAAWLMKIGKSLRHLQLNPKFTRH